LASNDSVHESCPCCKNTQLKFDAVAALGSYDQEIRQAVLQMKRPAHNTLSTAMGRLLAHRRHDFLLEQRADLIVPIPMFWTRRLGRGTNSPEILASCLGMSLNIPVRRNVLVRCRNTLPQADLSPTRRFQNMQGAFRIRHAQFLKNARILLVDDILTTGATCSEAARMLKQAGAVHVAVAVVAKAPGRRYGSLMTGATTQD
jgi:ComF family protein